MTVQHAAKHWLRGEQGRRSGTIKSYTPKGGAVSGSSKSQVQSRSSGRSRQLGTSAGRTKMSGGLRGINRRQRRV